VAARLGYGCLTEPARPEPPPSLMPADEPPPRPAMPADEPLPPPAVPAEVYDETYYRAACADFAQWSDTGERAIAGIYAYTLERTGFAKGQVLVDLGCGRGELVTLAAQRGAARAIGVEYSRDALTLAGTTVAAYDVAGRVELVLADARAVPLDDGIADLVALLDVVEHLSPPELERALAEAWRLLRPGGRLFVHTMPNRHIYEVVYRLQRNLLPWRRRSWPVDPRNDYERLMHVNEQTPGGLRRAIAQAGFASARCTLGSWIYTDYVPSARARRTYHRLARLGPLARLAVASLIGEGLKRPPAP
jgi:ubiquinone/menaquinone biosynthesis C-methylase UbiE